MYHLQNIQTKDTKLLQHKYPFPSGKHKYHLKNNNVRNQSTARLPSLDEHCSQTNKTMRRLICVVAMRRLICVVTMWNLVVPIPVLFCK